MENKSNTRRDFLKRTSAVMAVAALGEKRLVEAAASRPASSAPADRTKILNYNPKMGYRRLGKTGIMISEIALGGHGGKTPEDRIPILDRAIELGVNYLDTNMVSECELYGKALRDKRKNFYIGFASWPERLIPDWEEKISAESLMGEIDARLKAYRTDLLDLWRPVGATWGPGQNRRETLCEISPRVLDLVAEVYDEARRQGKVRWLGVSAHNDKVFQRVMKDYPQFSVILFPCLFLTKPQGGESLLKLAQEKDVGVIGIKPFGAGATFGIQPSEISGKLDARAHVLLKAMLADPRIAAIIPGVNDPEQLAENVKGSYDRDRPLSDSDRRAIDECEANFHAHVTPAYEWLYLWKTV